MRLRCHTGYWNVAAIEALIKVNTCDAQRIVKYIGIVANQVFDHCSFFAVGFGFAKLFYWYDAVFLAVFFQPSSEDQLVKPIEVGFE